MHICTHYTDSICSKRGCVQCRLSTPRRIRKVGLCRKGESERATNAPDSIIVFTINNTTNNTIVLLLIIMIIMLIVSY